MDKKNHESLLYATFGAMLFIFLWLSIITGVLFGVCNDVLNLTATEPETDAVIETTECTTAPEPTDILPTIEETIPSETQETVTETTEVTDPTEVPETTEATKVPEPTEATKIPEPTEVPEVTEPTKVPEPTEVPETTEPTEVPETTEPLPNVNPHDLELLACVIYQEAGGDMACDECRRRVADVVLNRVADPRFPNTIEEVLTQKSQYGRFHWTGVVWPERAKNELEAHAVARAYRIAEEVLLGNHSSLYGAGYIWQAEFKQGRDNVYHCGHYFGR